VDVATEKLNATTGTTLQDYYNYTVGNGVTGISSYKDYALLSFERTTLAGQPADKFVWQAMVPQKIDNTYQNTPLRAMQVLTVYNGTAFVVTYKATQSDYDKYLTQAQQTIDSFKFTS
jgi:hypothetical protein